MVGGLIILLLEYVVLVETTTSQSDDVPRLISVNAKRVTYNESTFYELNCSSTRQSIGNGAEFIIDGQTVEHIAFNDNICYNGKLQECTLDHCQCYPSDNAFIHKHKYKNENTDIIIGCKMRFFHNETGDVLKAVLSIRITETAIHKHAYNVKLLKKHKEIDEDDEDKISFPERITKWIPVLFGVLLINIACFIVVLWCHYQTKIENKKRYTKQTENYEMKGMLPTEECLEEEGKSKSASEDVEEGKKDFARKSEGNIDDHNIAGTSGLSIKTLEENRAPRLFDIVECTDCSITVEWLIDVEDEYSSYELVYRSPDSEILSVLTFSSKDVVEMEDGRRMYTLQNLLPETCYEFKLRSVYNDTNSHFSESKTKQTLKLGVKKSNFLF